MLVGSILVLWQIPPKYAISELKGKKLAPLCVAKTRQIKIKATKA